MHTMVTGDFHSIDLISIDRETFKKIKTDEIKIYHHDPSEWFHKKAEKVFQGFFQSTLIIRNENIELVREPKKLKLAESLTGFYIGIIEKKHASLSIDVGENLSEQKIEVVWQHIELGAEVHTFASVYHKGIEQANFNFDHIGECFFVIACEDGIVELDFSQDGTSFTLAEGKR